MLVSSLLQNAQNLIDLFWVGRLGSASVAALALSGTVLMMLFPVVMGTAAGTVAIVSRRVGERDLNAASDAAGQALGLAMVFGLVTAVTGYALTPRLCMLLGAPAEVIAPATVYLRIQFVGSFTVFLLFIGGHSIFQAAGNTVVPMAIMVLSNVVNLVLDPILIFGLCGFPRLGIRGAALATVTAQALSAAVALFLLGKGAFGIHIHPRRLLPRPRLAMKILAIGLPGTGQMLARSLMALVLMRIVAACGTAALAAFGIGHRLQMILLMPAFALGNSTATMMGQNLGAGKPGRARGAAWRAAGMDTGIMLSVGGLFVAFAPGLVGLFSSDPEVIAVGTSFLRITLPFYAFVALSIVLGRGLQGAGDTLSPMVMTVISLWGLQVPLAIYLSRVMTPPTDGIWWAIATAVTVHGLMVTAWFQTGRWKGRRV